MISKLARLKFRLHYCSNGGLIEGCAVSVQELNVCRDAVVVNHHGQDGHALNFFSGHAFRVWHIYGAQQPGRCDLGSGVVHAILIRNLVDRKTQ